MQVPVIRRVCVIGAGTMGSGIAAHLANLGFEVSLLDATAPSVQEAFERARAARPPHFYLPDRANEIRLGSTESDLGWAAEADWVCEAIVENLEAKRALLEQLDAILPPETMVSTNTSGLPIRALAAGRSDSFRRRFLGTHFFNPPRYLKLLELVPTADTDPEIVEGMRSFLEDRVARRVVLAKDTPGFIANRFGMWSMFHAVHVAERLHLSVEQVDAITGAFLGRPKSGSFRLNDIVGLDVMRDIAANLLERCPDDPHISTLNQPQTLTALLARGWIGEKVGRGYYRREGRELLALDLDTVAYRDVRAVDIPSLQSLGSLPLGERIARALELRDEAGEFLRLYLIPTLQYADYLKEEISHSVLDFDRVMMWGFGWEMGPFALIDAIGSERIGRPGPPFYQGRSQRLFSGRYEEPPNQPQFAPVSSYPLVGEGETYRLRDLGDEVLAVGLTTKMGVVSPLVVEELTDLVENKGIDRFILTSEAKSFSVGFDLAYLLRHIEMGAFEDIEVALARLQTLGSLLETRTCVAAVAGHCLGGGYELALSCSRIVAQAETQIGLPESKVGLLPGGRGLTLVRLYNQSNLKRLAEVAGHVVEGTVSQNADHARLLGYLRADDVTCYHPDALISRAKWVLQRTERGERPAWARSDAPLVGMLDRQFDQAYARGRLTEYDHIIAEHMKNVIGRATSYEDSLIRERHEFIALCRRPFTHARIKHMLETGKPLRN
ncbi:MAG TPA: 3-hydroxyacyl-CoA dehydrogenase NAD-binding domain-containing protein [Fimbriimonas sp.]